MILSSKLIWKSKSSDTELLLTISALLWAATRCVLRKKMLLKLLQNSQENTCARAFFLIKLPVCKFIKNEILAQVFSYEFCEFFGTPFLQNTSRRLLLTMGIQYCLFKKEKHRLFETFNSACIFANILSIKSGSRHKYVAK